MELLFSSFRDYASKYKMDAERPLQMCGGLFFNRKLRDIRKEHYCEFDKMTKAI